MTSPDLKSSMGNIMTRLQGLKNVKGRRVIPGAEFLEDLEPELPDASGTAQPGAGYRNIMQNNANMPQADMGGAITPQSTDVRANAVVNPEQEQAERSVYSKIGEALSSFVPYMQQEYQRLGIMQKPPVEQPVGPIEAISNRVQGLQNQPEKFSMEGWFPQGNYISDALKQYIKPFRTEEHWQGKATPENQQLIEDAQMKTQGINPEQKRAEDQQQAAITQQNLKEKIDKAAENPYTTMVYGATDTVYNQPELREKFKLYTGMDLTDQMAEMTRDYEKVMDDMDNQVNLEGTGYNEQEQRIKERILANQPSDSDKFFVGLALLMPVLVGAFFGKEAALGALAGGAKGVLGVYEGRAKENLENEKLLADIGQKKGETELRKSELQLKRLAIPQEIKKNLPKDEREFLKNKRLATWKDPETGEDREGFEVKPNLIALPEYVASKEEFGEMRKKADEISEAINPTKEINKLTSEIVDISSKMKDKNIMQQAWVSYLSGKNPGIATKTGEKVEFQGRMVNSYVVLEHKIKLLVDAYRQAKGMRALTSTVQEHIDGLFRNPAASFQSYQDTIDQMLYTRDLAQSRLLNQVESSGFVPEFVARSLQPDVEKLYGNLNYKEGEKESSELLR